jgi:hypothetical protein
MIDLGRITETADHALSLLDEVAKLVPGDRGTSLVNAIDSLRLAFNGAGIREALEEVQKNASAEAQAVADSWPDEPKKQ